MKFITSKEIKNSKDTVYIFGDNLTGIGLGGQAKVARPFVPYGQAFGIPTKRKPTNEPNAFFSDQPDEFEAVERSFSCIKDLKRAGNKIIFFPNIGKGYAKLPNKSPKINKMIEKFVNEFQN